jgi:hypothetical protein
MAMTMKNIVLWDLMPCNIVDGYQCFGGAEHSAFCLLVLLFDPEAGGSMFF